MDNNEIVEIIEADSEKCFLREPAPRTRRRRPDINKLTRTQLIELVNARRTITHERRLKSVMGIVGFLYRHKPEKQKALLHTLSSRALSVRVLMLSDQSVWLRMGLVRREALMMNKLLDVTRRTELGRFPKKLKLATLTMASPYMVATYHNTNKERFFLLCLNRLGNLKRKIYMSEGTGDAALFNVNAVVLAVLRETPAAIVMIHNHPGGTLMPSEDDLQQTRDTLHALQILGVPLLDHVIVAQSHVVSIRDNGYIPECDWNCISPNHPMMRRWLDENTVTGSIRKEMAEAEKLARKAGYKKNSRGARSYLYTKTGKGAKAAKTTKTAKTTKATKTAKPAAAANPPKTE